MHEGFPMHLLLGVILLVWLCGIGVGYGFRGMVDRRKRGEPMFPLPSQRAGR